MIIYVSGVRDGFEHVREQVVDFARAHANAQFDGLGLGGVALEFHGEMEHDLIAAAERLFSDFGGMRWPGKMESVSG